MTALRKCAGAMLMAWMLAAMPAPANAQLFGSRDDGETTVRLSQVEDQMRSLTGQIEQLNFQIRQLEEQIRRMQEDNEYRLQQLEGGTGKRSDAGSAGGASSLPGGVGSESYGAASGTLGQLPADVGSGDGAYGAAGGYGDAPAGGPLDLSALARGQGGGVAAGGGEATGGGAVAPGEGFGTSAGQVAAVSGGDPRSDYDASYSMILSGDYAGAQGGFERFLEAHPNDPLAANAQFWLGESHFARKQYRAAADAFLKSYTDYPDGTKVTDSLLKLGLSLKGLGQGEAACATFSELLSKYPGAPSAIRAEAQAQKQAGGCA
ncbi:tol-pal system protein YbgF [Stappia indica]|uniref:tol-pal system protein YbgF n=1 Tax=Stappia indica TaxID=538381 RepID=UPI001CD3B80B|nr:tol-pal system protein YbgF [Stappia indica]MCA1298215.1 tol-pal system protein YbgF [Stappia indica]